MMVLVIVPAEKLAAESSGILQTPKFHGKLRPILHRLELDVRIGVVFGHMRTTVGLGHSQIHQQCHRLRVHRGAPIGIQGELSGLNALALRGLLDQSLGQLSRYPIRQHPAHHVTAENAQDHLQVKVNPMNYLL